MHRFFILIHLLCSSTCFEHYCAHLQGNNCINTASGIVSLFGWLVSTQGTSPLVTCVLNRQNYNKKKTKIWTGLLRTELQSSDKRRCSEHLLRDLGIMIQSFFYQLEAQIIYFNTFYYIPLHVSSTTVLICRGTTLLTHLVPPLSLGDCSVHMVKEDCSPLVPCGLNSASSW